MISEILLNRSLYGSEIIRKIRKKNCSADIQ